MSSHDQFVQIISGERTGAMAAVVRAILRSFSWLYGWVTLLRNACFRTGLKRTIRVDVPVISLGNITTGGTGKTPLVAAVVRILQELGHRPGIVSRGYGADSSGTNDELRVLEHLCPGVPHVQDADRVAAARSAIRQHDADVIVLDDGMQHRRIHRDLNIVLIDATNPFGYDALLPRGLLRESLSGLGRADVIIITRCDQVSRTQLAETRRRLQQQAPHIGQDLFEVSFQPTKLLDRESQAVSLSDVDGRSVMVVTAIGNPQGFVATCHSAGANVACTRFFPDHYHYTANDLDSVWKEAARNSVSIILTTVKDFVKIRPLLPPWTVEDQPNVLAVEISTVFNPVTSDQRLAAIIGAAVSPQ